MVGPAAAGVGSMEFLRVLEATAGPRDAIEARKGHSRQGEEESTSRRMGRNWGPMGTDVITIVMGGIYCIYHPPNKWFFLWSPTL